MFTKSLWNSLSDIHDFPELHDDISTDVAIIGGGITGISAAKALADKGVDVTILESHRMGGGTSSHSTGNLYWNIDKILSSLQQKYDTDVVKAVAASRNEALKQMENWIESYQLDCDYRTVPWYLYGETEEQREKIDQALEAGRSAELPMSVADTAEIPFPSVSAVKIPDQGQFNPMRYIQEMAWMLHRREDRCRIFEHTHVSFVEEEDERCVLNTSGGQVTADHVIHATHTPKGIMVVQSLLGPYREYGIACTTRNVDHPEGTFWGYHEGNRKFSTRTYRRNGQQFTIVVGEPHKVGQANGNVEHIRNLEAFAENYFEVDEIVYRWGGQHYRPADLLPYIGPRKKGSREYIATGYSTDGLVYGTLAGMVLSDLLTGRDNPWAELYNATRKQPLKSASEFLKENLNVAKQYLKDLPGSADEMDTSDLKPGKGRVMEKDGHKLAVHRREDGELEVVSAVCTHMECIVNWNEAEQSWDCPCHGSRFTGDGTVIEGPAYHRLHRVRFNGDSPTVSPGHE